jgi:hypothetical protein
LRRDMTEWLLPPEDFGVDECRLRE